MQLVRPATAGEIAQETSIAVLENIDAIDALPPA